MPSSRELSDWRTRANYAAAAVARHDADFMTRYLSGLGSYEKRLVSSMVRNGDLRAERSARAEHASTPSSRPTSSQARRPTARPPAEGDNERRSIETVMQDQASYQTIEALVGAAKSRSAVLTIKESDTGGLVLVSMSTTTPEVGMLVTWAPSIYRSEWLQTTQPEPCDGYKVTLMSNEGNVLGDTFVGPADLVGMTGDPGSRFDYLMEKFADDVKRFGAGRVAAWSSRS